MPQITYFTRWSVTRETIQKSEFGIPLTITPLHQWCSQPLPQLQTLGFQWSLLLFCYVRYDHYREKALRLWILNSARWQDLGSRSHASGPQVGPKLKNSVLGITDVYVKRSSSADTLLFSFRWLEKMFTSTWLERSRHVHIHLLSLCIVLMMTP